MEFLDRYLEAVRKHLPWQRQNDIIAELRVNLEAQLEDKEAGLGRPLTKAEAEGWLKEFGSPMQMAARYRPQRHLIGPMLFPTYRHVLQLVVFWFVVIYAIASAVQIAMGPANGESVVHVALRLPFILLTVVAWVTLIFAAIEFMAAHWPEKFPRLADAAAAWPGTNLPTPDLRQSSGGKPRSFARAVMEVFFGALFLAWWLLIPHYPFLLFGVGARYLKAFPYQLTPVWVEFYWWVVALNLLQVTWHAVDLKRGSWRQAQPARQIIFKAFGLIPLVLLLTAPGRLLIMPKLAELKNPALSPAALAAHGVTADAINQAAHKGLLVVLAIVLLTLLWEIAQASLNHYRQRAAAMR